MNDNDWPGPRHVFRWAILGIVILVVVWFALFALSFIMQPMLGFHYFFYRPFFFPFGFLFGLLVLFIIFGALRSTFWPWGLRYRRRYWRYHDQSYHILRERYARGEITKDQFEQMIRDLKAQEQGTGTP
jgi:putative membrane protein